MMNIKLQNAAQRRFVFFECYVVKMLLCVACFSRTFSTFLDHSWIITVKACLHFSMSQQIFISYWNHKICQLMLFACLVFSRTSCEMVYKFQASCFDELSFCPRAGVLCLVKCDEGRFSSCVFTSWNILKFKWEFVIIGRGCLVVLKFKSSLYWPMLCFKAL